MYNYTLICSSIISTPGGVKLQRVHRKMDALQTEKIHVEAGENSQCACTCICTLYTDVVVVVVNVAYSDIVVCLVVVFALLLLLSLLWSERDELLMRMSELEAQLDGLQQKVHVHVHINLHVQSWAVMGSSQILMEYCVYACMCIVCIYTCTCMHMYNCTCTGYCIHVHVHVLCKFTSY